MTIHVQKQLVDVSATDPQAKQTRTVTLHYVYGDGPKAGQKAFDDAVLNVYYHRTATLDRATNQTKYGDWLWDQSQGDPSTPGYHVVSGKWTNLPQSWDGVRADVHDVIGYTADLGTNDPKNINHIPANKWVHPIYNTAGDNGTSDSDKGSTAYLDTNSLYEAKPTHTIVYNLATVTKQVQVVDDDEKGIQLYGSGGDLQGKYGETIALTDPRVQKLLPSTDDGYYLTPGQTTPITFDLANNTITLHVKHTIEKATSYASFVLRSHCPRPRSWWS